MSGVDGVLARIRSALGWATADRRVEAQGKLEELDAAQATASPGSASAVLDEAELEVRSDHGDLAPEAEPEDHRPAAPPEGG